MLFTDVDAQNLTLLADGMGFGRSHDSIRRALREIEMLRSDFDALQTALVGKTGLSAIGEAHRLWKLHPLSLSE